MAALATLLRAAEGADVNEEAIKVSEDLLRECRALNPEHRARVADYLAVEISARGDAMTTEERELGEAHVRAIREMGVA